MNLLPDHPSKGSVSSMTSLICSMPTDVCAHNQPEDISIRNVTHPDQSRSDPLLAPRGRRVDDEGLGITNFRTFDNHGLSLD